MNFSISKNAYIAESEYKQFYKPVVSNLFCAMAHFDVKSRPKLHAA